MSTDFISLDDYTDAATRAADAEAKNHQEGFYGLYSAVDQLYSNLVAELSAPQESGICAKVRVRINQQATLTRTAFKATFDLINQQANVKLETVKVDLKITDGRGNDAGSLFGVPPPALSGFGAIDGTGSVAANSTGTAVWTITPTRDAAPKQATTYYVGGTVTYTQNGKQVTIPLFPASINVMPDPLLVFHYFWQRDVYSDDPFTPQIEPAEPFSLGLLVFNKGYGTARSLQIASSQPQIVDNEKGLLIDFKIIGSQVNTDKVSPSLTVGLGDIGPLQTGVARWTLTSSLQGKFIAYSADFKHIDDLGNPRTSLIDSVDIHELEHVVRIDSPTDDNKPDFLVNDIPDVNNLPDTVYSSDGTIAPVTALTSASIDSPPSATHLMVKLSLASSPSGFVYLRIDDPAQGGKYRLLRVLRSDGKDVLLDDNAWTTSRTIRLQGQNPFQQNRFYLFDRDTTGQYTLVYGLNNPLNATKIGADGAQVSYTAVPVTGMFRDGIYVEAADRSSGIKVVPLNDSVFPAGLHEGALASVVGTLKTAANGERYVEALNVKTGGDGPIEPLGITSKSLYGGDFFYTADSGSGQRGMTGGIGLNSVGLLVTTLGKVTAAGVGQFQMTDGYGMPITVALSSDADSPKPGVFVLATGLVSMHNTNGVYTPLLRVRRAGDLIYNPQTRIGGTLSSPTTVFQTGENNFSLPGIPADPSPTGVLQNYDPGDGSFLDRRLHRFDQTGQVEVDFLAGSQGDFGPMLLGEGYRLTLPTDANPTYPGIQFAGFLANFADQWVALPKLGATKIGPPFPYPTDYESLYITDGSSTQSIRDAIHTQFPPWIDTWMYYARPGGIAYDQHLGLPDDAPDSTMLMPWMAYFVQSKRDNLALIVPSASPAVTISALSPNSATAGDAGFTLTVTGQNFAQGAVLSWNGSPRSTTVQSPTTVTAVIPSTDIATAGTAAVVVTNPAPGYRVSNSLPFTIKANPNNNPVPTLSGVNPASANAGDPDTAITLTGSGYTASSQVYFDNTPLTTTYMNATTLTTTVPASQLAYGGLHSVTVFNPVPGGGLSNAVSFLVVGNPRPVANALSPTSVIAGGSDFTLTVTGSAFVNGSTIQWNGKSLDTKFVSDTSLTATVPAGNIALAGTASITVNSPKPGGGTSGALTLTVNNPAPILNAIAPSSVPAGSRDTTLTLTGSGFVTTSTARIDGTALTTTYGSSTSLTVVVPAASLAIAGTHNISVANPTPGGGESAGQTLNVVGVPLLAISSASAERDGSVAVTVTIRNAGTGSAKSVRITGARLGVDKSITVPPDLTIGDIAPGSLVTRTISFPRSVPSGTRVLQLTGAFSSNNVSLVLSLTRAVRVP